MGWELEVEWYNPKAWPLAPADQQGAWVQVWTGEGDELDTALAEFTMLGEDGKVARITWRPTQ